MKKLLLLFYFLFFSYANAELIEINNCIYTASGNQKIYDIRINKNVSHEEFKYDHDYYQKYNSMLKISKKKFRENYIKWGWDKEQSDDWYKHFDPFKNPKPVWRLSGTNITSNQINKPGLIIYDPWEERLNDDYDYIWLSRITTLDKDTLDKFKSAGAEIFKIKINDIWSINTNSGIVTYLETSSDKYFEHERKTRFINLANPPTEMFETYAKNNPIKKVDTQKYEIDSYAGGILIAYEIGSSIKNKIIFDFNDMSLSKYYTINGTEEQFARYKCPSSYNDQNDDGSSSGTAFFVSNKGHLLTNNHVVDGCEVSKINYKGKDYNTQLLATDKTLDLALLKVDFKNKSYINFSSDEAKKMQKIYVGGYPLGKGLSDDLKISSGIVSSLKGFEDNSNEIQIDAAINSGNSGGPIINEDGELIAIAVSGMSKDKTEGINFGIKASAAERFLKSNNLKASSSFFSSSKNNDELLEILEEATVYTYCD